MLSDSLNGYITLGSVPESAQTGIVLFWKWILSLVSEPWKMWLFQHELQKGTGVWMVRGTCYCSVRACLHDLSGYWYLSSWLWPWTALSAGSKRAPSFRPLWYIPRKQQPWEQTTGSNSFFPSFLDNRARKVSYCETTTGQAVSGKYRLGHVWAQTFPDVSLFKVVANPDSSPCRNVYQDHRVSCFCFFP